MTDTNQKPINQISPPSAAPWFFAWLALASAVLTVLYAPTLNAFFLDDELSIIGIVSPTLGKGWIDACRPYNLGFFRPINLLLTRTLLILFGPTPFPFHGLALLILAIVAALAGLVARRITHSNRIGTLAALLTALHCGTWAAGIMLSSTCDTLMAIGFLAGLLAWDTWLTRPGKGRFLALGLCFAFALASKETAVVFPVYLLFWGWARGMMNRRAWMALGGIALMAGAYVVWIAMLQINATHSYFNNQAIDLNPLHFLLIFADYAMSLAVPSLHVLPWPDERITLSQPVYWLLNGQQLIEE